MSGGPQEAVPDPNGQHAYEAPTAAECTRNTHWKKRVALFAAAGNSRVQAAPLAANCAIAYHLPPSPTPDKLPFCKFVPSSSLPLPTPLPFIARARSQAPREMAAICKVRAGFTASRALTFRGKPSSLFSLFCIRLPPRPPTTCKLHTPPLQHPWLPGGPHSTQEAVPSPNGQHACEAPASAECARNMHWVYGSKKQRLL